MLREALELIQDTATKAAGPKDLPSASNHAMRVLLPDGKIDEVSADPPKRNHTVYDIDSLAIYGSDAVLWHSDTEVVAVLDDEKYRDNRVTLPLPVHPKFAAIERQTGNSFTQKGLIDFLRLNIKQEIEEAHPGFISTLREIRIQQSVAGDSSIKHGRESMGKTIDNAVTGADALPDEFVLSLPLWLHLSVIVQLHCVFDIDVTTATFSFRPKPGELEKARATAQQWLHGQLETACESATILFGKP